MMSSAEITKKLRAKKDSPLEWLAAAKIEKLTLALTYIVQLENREEQFHLRDAAKIAAAALSE